MNMRYTKLFFSAVAALVITACSDYEDDFITGGDGSDYIASGTISGFGSVFVNGIEYETDSAVITVDGEPATESGLATGMVVQVGGLINPDAATGTATAIDFDGAVQGPVVNLTLPDSDGISRSFTIFDTTVVIDSSSTRFDISDSVPAGTEFDFDNIANNSNVEVSGFYNSEGKLLATRLELKETNFSASSTVAVTGTISNLQNNKFDIKKGLQVDASSAQLVNLPNGLSNGLNVKVTGTVNTSTNTITAVRIGAKDNLFADSNEFMLEGIITDYVDDGNFMVFGIPVNAGSARFTPRTLQAENDLRVQVAGAIRYGVLFANEVELKGGDIKAHATVTSVDTAANSFEITPVFIFQQPAITVTVTASTQLVDDVNDIEPFTLHDLVPITDFVHVRGYDDGSGGIIATEVQIRQPDSVLLQGIMQSGETIGRIKLLGVEFIIDDPGQTRFEGVNDQQIDQNTFYQLITRDVSVIKIVDVEPDGTANEIEIESP